MLIDLSVSDFALAKQLDLEFGPGLNVMTGETGAGKSIIIGAITGLVGGRTTAEQVRQGEEKALLAATFDVNEHLPVAKQLNELDLWEHEHQQLVTREIAQTGRSRCRVNGRMVTVSMLADIGASLVDIHGQHDHQSLMTTAKHLDLLDALGGEALVQLKDQVAELFDERSRLLAEIERIRQDEQDRERLEDLLKYQIDEISAANLYADEEADLEREWSRLAHAERLFEGVREAYVALYEGDGHRHGVTHTVGEIAHTLASLSELDPQLHDHQQSVQDALAALEEVSRDLRRYSDDLQIDPDRLQEVDDRRQLIARLKRKYGSTVREVLEFLAQCQAQLNALTDSAERLDALQHQLAQVSNRLTHACVKLSDMRKQVAKRINERITERLVGLSMPSARFEVAFSTHDDPQGIEVDGQHVRITRRGIDVVEFLFSANAGESLKPLAKIASGGEMSRVMLAIKAAMAEADPVPTLIFDEVDAGLGGQAAERVADTLAELATTHQVLVVTHLAQIAVRADRHFLVEKYDEEGRTLTSVRRLTGDERVREIARMLDGLSTSTSIEHAQALLARAGKNVFQR